ncbi:MAG TPA: response regulator [Bryobacteraceae bacterium]|nr:response regulator [Bryobacteraceae bacterium]
MAAVQILVVEDHDLQSKLVRFLLEEAGHSVRTAASAEEAREILRSFFPNLILMDLQLPGMDGLDLTRLLRLDPVHSTTPIIALTVYTHPSDLQKAREAGCNGKISKPIDTATFARRIGRFLNLNQDSYADVPSDSHDLLAELRNNFLAEGLDQASRILKDLKSDPGCSTELIERVLHHWTGLAATLGFPEISDQSGKIEALITSSNPEYQEVENAIKIARRKFGSAASRPPKLPLDLLDGLMGMRIGLLNFSDQEENRIRSVARRANVEIVIDRINTIENQPVSIETQTEYNALIINQCAAFGRAAPQEPQLSVPAVFIHSRASLPSVSKLPARAYDFLIAPWDAEELLIRVCRLTARAAPRHPATASPDSKRPRVLIADDDPDIVAIVAETLRQLDMHCDIARSGEQALEAVHRSLPDAIVLDVNMVDLDGFEVLKRLRGNLNTKRIPVLLLTARGQPNDIARGFECGADDYVVKPFQPLDLVKRVDKMISAHRQALAAALGELPYQTR